MCKVLIQSSSRLLHIHIIITPPHTTSHLPAAPLAVITIPPLVGLNLDNSLSHTLQEEEDGGTISTSISGECWVSHISKMLWGWQWCECVVYSIVLCIDIDVCYNSSSQSIYFKFSSSLSGRMVSISFQSSSKLFTHPHTNTTLHYTTLTLNYIFQLITTHYHGGDLI